MKKIQTLDNFKVRYHSILEIRKKNLLYDCSFLTYQVIYYNKLWFTINVYYIQVVLQNVQPREPMWTINKIIKDKKLKWRVKVNS